MSIGSFIAGFMAAIVAEFAILAIILLVCAVRLNDDRDEDKQKGGKLWQVSKLYKC